MQKTIFLLAFFGFGCTTLQAQFLSIDTNAPATTSHALNTLSTITFSGGNMVVTPTTGAATNYALTGLTGTTAKLYFTSTNLANESFTTDADAFVLYPNPTKDFLHFQAKTTNEAIESITIYNLLGKQVLTQKASNNEAINVSGLPQGIYMCQVKTATTSQTIKFIKS
jgi:hypothetical protein